MLLTSFDDLPIIAYLNVTHQMSRLLSPGPANLGSIHQDLIHFKWICSDDTFQEASVDCTNSWPELHHRGSR